VITNFRFPKAQRGALLSLLVMLSLICMVCADDAADQEPLPLQLPKARLEGTPKNISNVNLDKSVAGKPRPPFMAPKGCTNVAKGKTVTSSDSNPIIGTLDQVTDGDKEAADGSFVELAEGKQWVQVDLGATYSIAAIIVWHRHDDARVYRDVVIQVSDDPDFNNNVITLFNNDLTNGVGLGVGKDFEYVESNEGKLVDGKATKARYVRLYSKGSTADQQNHYTEVEVWAPPTK
jgi:hypothetical protein